MRFQATSHAGVRKACAGKRPAFCVENPTTGSAGPLIILTHLAPYGLNTLIAQCITHLRNADHSRRHCDRRERLTGIVLARHDVIAVPGVRTKHTARARDRLDALQSLTTKRQM